MSAKPFEPSEMIEWYFDNFNSLEAGLNGAKNTPLHTLRRQAIRHFGEVGFPGKKNESWKYTSVSPILKHKFRPEAPATRHEVEMPQEFLIPGLEDRRLVFINGRYSPQLSKLERRAPGLKVVPLSQSLGEKNPLLWKHFSRHADFQEEPFTALNTAFANDGVFIHLEKDVDAGEPLHLVFLSDSGTFPVNANPRLLLVTEPGSRLQTVESYHGLSAEPFFNNIVSEVVVGEGSRIEQVKIQDEGAATDHVYNLQVVQARGSYYSIANVDSGGQLVRNNLNIRLAGENAESHIVGLYMASGKQHIDNHTFIDHAMSNCFSNELYKGILGGRARGVFNGQIMVRQDAQKTNAYQNNKALLLSDDAIVNSKPELEIFADDVKCSHGATVGQLDAEALFYLCSRGIPREEAYSLLQYAFSCEIFEYVMIPTVRTRLEKMMLERFKTL